MTLVLGIDVDDDLVGRWVDWLAPDVQPFFVESGTQWPDLGSRDPGLTAEHRDTYRVWKIDRTLAVLWISEDDFYGLERRDRSALVRSQVVHRRGAVPTVRRWSDLFDAGHLRAQADGHRFVWWPSLLHAHPSRVLERVVATERMSSRHGEVTNRTWRRCAPLLPATQSLAGTFPAGSGANCFGTVMAAAGMASERDDWTQTATFTNWLAMTCAPGGDDNAPGTVLVWRDRSGDPVHAGVTMGEGWVLEKPSQEWHSPRTVVTVHDLIRTMRSPGQRLERHRIRGARYRPAAT